jgi:hypothetical protein
MGTSPAAVPEVTAAFNHISAFLARHSGTRGILHHGCRYALVDSAPHEFRVFGSRFERGFGCRELDSRFATHREAEVYAEAARAYGFSMVHVSPPQCDYRGELWSEAVGGVVLMARTIRREAFERAINLTQDTQDYPDDSLRVRSYVGRGPTAPCAAMEHVEQFLHGTLAAPRRGRSASRYRRSRQRD